MMEHIIMSRSAIRWYLQHNSSSGAMKALFTVPGAMQKVLLIA